MPRSFLGSALSSVEPDGDGRADQRVVRSAVTHPSRGIKPCPRSSSMGFGTPSAAKVAADAAHCEPAEEARGYGNRMPQATVAMQLAHTSLLHGWVPMALHVIAASVLVLAIGWRSRRWRMLWVPVSVLLGVAAAGGTSWYFDWAGLAGHPAPPMLWIWTMLTGLACGVLIFGWRNNRRWRLAVSVLAVPCCLLCVALKANLWTRGDGAERLGSAHRSPVAR